MNLEIQLADAKRDLQRIREKFKDDPELLAIYEPSAIYLVQLLEEGRETHDGQG